MKENTKTAVVIGGGIVGICCALFLQKKGLNVTVIDPSEAGESTAKWSCGQMAVSEIIPLSKKGILKKITSKITQQQLIDMKKLLIFFMECQKNPHI